MLQNYTCPELDHKKPIIFLDIDGVLQPRENQNCFYGDLDKLSEKLSQEQDKEYSEIGKYDLGAVYYDWDKNSVENLRTLIVKADAEIVLSSDWRIFHSFQHLKLLFKIHNLDKYLISRTSNTGNGYGCYRDSKIEDYLINNPEIKQFVIIDDKYGDEFMARYPKHFVKTENHFTEKHLSEALKAIKIIDFKENKPPTSVIKFQKFCDNDKKITSLKFNMEDISKICRYHSFSRTKFMNRISEAIQNNTYVNNFSFINFTQIFPGTTDNNSEQIKSEFSRIYTALSNNKVIKQLDFSETHLMYVDVFFDKILKREKKLDVLILKNTYLEIKDDYKELADFIKEYKHPVKIDITVNRWGFGQRYVSNLKEALSTNKNITVKANYFQFDFSWSKEIPDNLLLER